LNEGTSKTPERRIKKGGGWKTGEEITPQEGGKRERLRKENASWTGVEPPTLRRRKDQYKETLMKKEKGEGGRGSWGCDAKEKSGSF